MTPKSLLLPALEGNVDAQAMLCDYLKEQGIPDHIADECYFAAIYPLGRYRRANEYQRGRGSGIGSGHGYGAGRGSGHGYGAGNGSVIGTGAGK